MRARVTYRGRVQGVGFRATVQTLAHDHRVTGWVRNEPDGSVLLEAQGEIPEVESLLTRIGQAMGRYIHAADRAEASDLPAESGFHIQR